MIHKSFSAETKVLDTTKGLVECVFSVTGVVDRQNDKILPGAFRKALAAKRSVPVVYAHSWTDINAVLGKTVGWAELMPGDSRLGPRLQSKGYGGVKAVVQFDQETPSGRLALTHVANGNLKDWSFAFDSNKSLERYDETGVREIPEIPEIYEVTVALVGANQEAMTLALQKTMAIQSAQTGPEREAYLIRKINGQIAQLERGNPDAETRAVLEVAKALVADMDPDRKAWDRIFSYIRSLD